MCIPPGKILGTPLVEGVREDQSPSGEMAGPGEAGGWGVSLDMEPTQEILYVG
jgi:hypothetical protein